MTRTGLAFIVVALILAPAARGEEGLSSPPVPSVSAPDVPPPPPPEDSPGFREGHPRRGPRGPGAGGFHSRFREELEAMKEEITRTRSLIAGLEGEIEAAPDGPARQDLRRRLDEARRHSAELQLTLARKKVEITRQALEFSQKRYDDARLELEKTTRRIKRQYPDLVVPPDCPPAPCGQ